MPENTLKIKAYVKLFEQVVFRDPQLSYEYTKKGQILTSKKIGLGIWRFIVGQDVTTVIAVSFYRHPPFIYYFI